MKKKTDNCKKVIFAGIGAMATTAEKSKHILDKMADKGESVVEQEKKRNKKFRHNVKCVLGERKASVENLAMIEEYRTQFREMTPEQIEQIKSLLQEMENTLSCEEEE